MTDELKPCPKCGSDVLSINGIRPCNFVECYECGNSVYGTDEHAVIQVWNQRANDGG
ncbi:Lar family restriction alleviation protein [Xenorhabdus yunnanensis]|uniref:Lar family restriction alleviation protein n=1 Tax=Xenorhabdus yunnanensis TaxID=3025878 RepID=UPI00359C30F9